MRDGRARLRRGQPRLPRAGPGTSAGWCSASAIAPRAPTHAGRPPEGPGAVDWRCRPTSGMAKKRSRSRDAGAGSGRQPPASRPDTRRPPVGPCGRAAGARPSTSRRPRRHRAARPDRRRRRRVRRRARGVLADAAGDRRDAGSWPSSSSSTCRRSTRARWCRCCRSQTRDAGRPGRPRACASRPATSTSSRRTCRWRCAATSCTCRRARTIASRYTPIDALLRVAGRSRMQERGDRRRPVRHRHPTARSACATSRPCGGAHLRAGARHRRSTTACRARRSTPAWSIWC